MRRNRRWTACISTGHEAGTTRQREEQEDTRKNTRKGSIKMHRSSLSKKIILRQRRFCQAQSSSRLIFIFLHHPSDEVIVRSRKPIADEPTASLALFLVLLKRNELHWYASPNNQRRSVSRHIMREGPSAHLKRSQERRSAHHLVLCGNGMLHRLGSVQLHTIRDGVGR